MSKRKRRVSKPKVEEDPIGGKDAPLPPKPETGEVEHLQSLKRQREKLALKAIVADLEAEPIIPVVPHYAEANASPTYRRYQKLLAQLKALAE